MESERERERDAEEMSERRWSRRVYKPIQWNGRTKSGDEDYEDERAIDGLLKNECMNKYNNNDNNK